MNPYSDRTKHPSVCFVHDWLVAMRGGEKVLESMVELFPDAPIFTLFVQKEKLSPALQRREIYTSFLQWVPGISRFYRWLLPLFPFVIRFIDVKKYDVVISSSHCVAKAVSVKKDSLHICYCYTPMRYLWEFSDEYLGKFPQFFRLLIELYFRSLQKWDIATSKRVDVFITSSKNIAEKINHLYGKTATVINPPIDFIPVAATTAKTAEEDYFLVVSALVPYKRVELAIDAFNQLRRPLKIVGDGPLKPQLEKMVCYPGIELEGWVDQETLWKRYARCRALIFPGEEDFGIVPIEAQMFGKPVIAFGKGGATESVIAINARPQGNSMNKSTGIFFYEPTAESLIQTIDEFQKMNFDPYFIRNHAKTFNKKRFKDELLSSLKEILDSDSVSFSKTSLNFIPDYSK